MLRYHAVIDHPCYIYPVLSMPYSLPFKHHIDSPEPLRPPASRSPPSVPLPSPLLSSQCATIKSDLSSATYSASPTAEQLKNSELRAHLTKACKELEVERTAKRALEDALPEANLRRRPLEDAIAEKQVRLVELRYELQVLRSRGTEEAGFSGMVTYD